MHICIPIHLAASLVHTPSSNSSIEVSVTIFIIFPTQGNYVLYSGYTVCCANFTDKERVCSKNSSRNGPPIHILEQVPDFTSSISPVPLTEQIGHPMAAPTRTLGHIATQERAPIPSQHPQSWSLLLHTLAVVGCYRGELELAFMVFDEWKSTYLVAFGGAILAGVVSVGKIPVTVMVTSSVEVDVG